MKHLRVYEDVNTTGVANVIGDLIDKYSSDLLIDHVEVHPFKASIIMKIYKDFSSETYKEFRKFFDVLDKLELKWDFDYTELNGINFSIDFSNFNRKEMDFMIQTKKFNL